MIFLGACLEFGLLDLRVQGLQPLRLYGTELSVYSLVVEADWEGYIGREPKGDNGFGYDPLFLVGETGKTAAELSSEEKNEQSHRGQAVKKLMEVFPAWQNNQ